MEGLERPIPFTAIDAYARRYGVEGEAFDLLLRFVSVIDFAYLDIAHKERQAPAPPVIEHILQEQT